MQKRNTPSGCFFRVRNKYYEKMIFIWNRGVVLYEYYNNIRKNVSNRLIN